MKYINLFLYCMILTMGTIESSECSVRKIRGKQSVFYIKETLYQGSKAQERASWTILEGYSARSFNKKCVVDYITQTAAKEIFDRLKSEYESKLESYPTSDTLPTKNGSLNREQWKEARTAYWRKEQKE